MSSTHFSTNEDILTFEILEQTFPTSEFLSALLQWASAAAFVLPDIVGHFGSGSVISSGSKTYGVVVECCKEMYFPSLCL